MASVAQAISTTRHTNQIAAIDHARNLYGKLRYELSRRPIRRAASSSQLRNQFCPKAREFLVGNSARLLEPVKLLDLVGNAEADHAPEVFARLLRLLACSFRHASRLGDHVREDANIGEHDQTNHPKRLDPTGCVMAPQQVANDYNEQPKPDDEHEHREGVG